MLNYDLTFLLAAGNLEEERVPECVGDAMVRKLRSAYIGAEGFA